VLGIRCASYVTELVEHAGGPHLLLRDASPGPLSIRDATGTAQVLADECEMALFGREYRGIFDDARGSIEALLAKHDISPVDVTGTVRGISFVERVLLAGDPVTASGFARQIVSSNGPDQGTAGYRDVATQLELSSIPGQAACVSDDPKALQVNRGR